MASAVVLYAIGVRRLHLHDFSAFVVTVLALAAGIVVVFVATRDNGGGSPTGAVEDPSDQSASSRSR